VTESTSTELARQPITEDAVPEKVRNLIRALKLNATFDTGQAQLSIMDRILAAETEEEIFAAANAGTVSGKDLAGRPFVLVSDNVEWKTSAEQYRTQGAFPFYALIRCTALDTGDEVVADCGGYSFVATLWALTSRGFLQAYEEQGGMPLVIEAKRMTSGYDVLLLQPYRGPLWQPVNGEKSTASKS
jgi:hypothetical protein